MVAVDAMGGDFAPFSIIQGAVGAAKRGISVCLYGDERKIIVFLSQLCPLWKNLPISLVHCSQTIAMDEEPSKSFLRKKDSSLAQAIRSVCQGKADAIVSAGNSGACLVAGMLMLGKLRGIARPAVGGFLPTNGDSVFCTDLGANVDCKPEFLCQFALLGSAYVQLVKGIASPRIGLLCNGTEVSKGTKVVQQAHDILRCSELNFVGNCEPSDIFNDQADVLVCEGFSGNIMLKTMEATVQLVSQWLKDEGNKSLFGRGVGLLGLPVFKRLKKNIKKVQRGGALLLGLNKPLVIAHGASNAAAIEDAIEFANSVSSTGFYQAYSDLVVELLRTNSSFAALSEAVSKKPVGVEKLETFQGA